MSGGEHFRQIDMKEEIDESKKENGGRRRVERNGRKGGKEGSRGK